MTLLQCKILTPLLFTVFSCTAIAGDNPHILWHNADTGAIKFMPVNGMTPENTLPVVDSSNTNLLPKGMGDFTGDGQPDILFHNQNSGNLRIWEMDGTTKIENIQVLGSSNTNLQIAGVGDFDGDGDNDIATFNTNSGALRIWVMEGTERVDNVSVLTGANTNLVPRGAGDMNNDGIPDIVLRNNNSGAVRVWTMNSDFTRKGNEYVTGSSNTNLELRGVVDINSDGNNDILNYNTNTGKLRAWLMDGNLGITDNAEVTQDADFSWSPRSGISLIDLTVVSNAAAYSTSPILGQEFNITMEDNDLPIKYTWSVVSQPKSSNVILRPSVNTKSVTLTASVVGEYILSIIDSFGTKKITHFTISNVFRFDKSQIEDYDGSTDIKKVSGIIKNQYWVNSSILSENNLEIIIAKYPEFVSLGYDKIHGLLIEKVHPDNDVDESIKQLALEKGIRSVHHRYFTGDDAYVTSKIANDGSKFNDLGDNWHLEYINIEDAWDISTGNANILIGITDEGFYRRHEDLKNNFEHSFTTIQHSHGTGVSGIIAATTNNKKGMSGINWKSKLVVGRFGAGYINTLTYDENVKLINNSWSSGKNTKRTQKAGIDKTRNYRDIAIKYANKLHIWSAGNDHTNADTSNGALHLIDDGTYSELKNVIVVAALLKDSKLASYSNYGRTVDIAAPTEFKSTASIDENNISIYDTAATSDEYGTAYSGGFNGTSAASPVVTGVASLIYSVIPDLSPIDVKSILIESSTTSVSERHNGSSSINFTEKENGSHPAIPILNAKDALEMTQNIKNGQIAKSELGIPNPFVPEVRMRVSSANNQLETTSLTFDVAASNSTTEFNIIDNIASNSEEVQFFLHSDYKSYHIEGDAAFTHNKTGITRNARFFTEFILGKRILEIVDENSLNPISNVSIEIEPMHIDWSAYSEFKDIGYSDISGKVNVYLSRGVYKIFFKADGYNDFTTLFGVNSSLDAEESHQFTMTPDNPKATIDFSNSVVQWEEAVNSTYVGGNTYKHRYMLALYEDTSCRLVNLNMEIGKQNEDKKTLYENTNKIYIPDTALEETSSCTWSNSNDLLTLSFYYGDQVTTIPLVDGTLRIGDVMDGECDVSNGCKVKKLSPIDTVNKNAISNHALEMFTDEGEVLTWYFREDSSVKIYSEGNTTIQFEGNWSMSDSYIYVLNSEGSTVLRAANIAYRGVDLIDFRSLKGYISNISTLQP